MTNTIAASASAVAAAKVAEKVALVATEAATAALADVQARVDALNAQKGAIAAERRAGNPSPDHVGRLSVIELDLADLAPLVAEKAAVVAEKNSRLVAARQDVAFAQQMFDGEVANEGLDRLKAHVSELDAVMFATVNQLAATAAALGMSIERVWAPSRALADVLHKLDMRRMGV